MIQTQQRFPYVTSTNADNPDMEKTPVIHGILLGDNE